VGGKVARGHISDMPLTHPFSSFSQPEFEKLLQTQICFHIFNPGLMIERDPKSIKFEFSKGVKTVTLNVTYFFLE
jgi:hypothetical protein